jgi:chlorophyllase-like protein
VIGAETSVVETFYPSNISNDSSHPLIVFTIGGGYAGLSVADYVTFLEYLASHGYIVCAANFNPLTTHQVGVADETQAENLIVNYASSTSFPLSNAVDLNEIGALGHSRGGESVIIQAATDNRIKVMLAMSAANDTWAIGNSTLVKVPAMLLFGSNDANAPLSDNVNYYNNFQGQKEYIQISGATHDLGIWNGIPYGFPYNQTTTPTTEKYVLAWFNYYLYANSTALNVFNAAALANDYSSGIISSYAISGISASLQEPSASITSVPSQLAQVLSSTAASTALFRAFLTTKPAQTMQSILRRRHQSAR